MNGEDLLKNIFNREMEKRNIPVRHNLNFINSVTIWFDFDKLLSDYFGEGDFFVPKEEKKQFQQRFTINIMLNEIRLKEGLERVDRALLRKKLKEI